MAEEPEGRERTLALIRAQHTFPGEYRFRIVVRPEDRVRILSVVTGVVGSSQVVDIEEQPSSKGAYVALRVRVHLDNAEGVLAVYDALQGTPGVLAVM